MFVITGCERNYYWFDLAKVAESGTELASSQLWLCGNEVETV